MLFCRAVWQRLGPLARKTVFLPLFKNAGPKRQMSFGIPGGSTTNMAYVVLCGGGLTAAVVYAYKTVNGDSERYNDRLIEISSRQKEAPAISVEEAEPSAEAVEAPAETAPVEVEVEVVATVADEHVAEIAAEPEVEAPAVDLVAVMTESSPGSVAEVTPDADPEVVSTAAPRFLEEVAIAEAPAVEAHGEEVEVEMAIAAPEAEANPVPEVAA